MKRKKLGKPVTVHHMLNTDRGRPKAPPCLVCRKPTNGHVEWRCVHSQWSPSGAFELVAYVCGECMLKRSKLLYAVETSTHRLHRFAPLLKTVERERRRKDRFHRQWVSGD